MKKFRIVSVMNSDAMIEYHIQAYTGRFLFIFAERWEDFYVMKWFHTLEEAEEDVVKLLRTAKMIQARERYGVKVHKEF